MVTAGAATTGDSDAFWAEDEAALLARLGSSRAGLSQAQAGERAVSRAFGSSRLPGWRLVLRQVENPIVLLLIAATALSMALGDLIDGVIILVITSASATLGYL